MARIQTRDVTIIMQDGLSGTASVDDIAGIIDTDTDIDIDFTGTGDGLNTDLVNKVPVGARFTIPGGDGTIYTVTATTEAADVTTNIVWTPAADASNVCADDAQLTFLPQQVEVKLGDGDLTWTEAREFLYDLDRDVLDAVRQGADQPMSVDLASVFEYVSAESGNPPTPRDIVYREGEASEWVSSDADQCNPYAIDILVRHCVPCGTDQDSEILLPDFRAESMDFSIQDATISFSGQCNATKATITRSTNTECA